MERSALNKTVRLYLLVTYLWAGISVASCLVRNDFNVLFAFLIIYILNVGFIENPKTYAKVIIHILTFLIIFDIIWFATVVPNWNNPGINNKYWASLNFIHFVGIALSSLQLLLKCLYLAFFLNRYLTNYSQDKSFLLSYGYPTKIDDNINL